MNRGFGRNLVAVSVVHLLAVFVIMFAGIFPSCRPKPRPVKFMPVQLMVGGPPAPAHAPKQQVKPAPLPPVPEPPVLPKAVPPPPREIKKTPVKPPTPKPPQKPKPQKPVPTQPRKPTVRQPPKMTKAQIEDALMSSTTPRNPVSAVVSSAAVSEGDIDPDLAIVYQAFYDAWSQPSYTDVGDATANVTIQLALDGTVLDRTLTKSSGNTVLDASVMGAAETVRRIEGLSVDFTERYRRVTVEFQVTEEE